MCKMASGEEKPNTGEVPADLAAYNWTHRRTKKKYSITPHRELFILIVNRDVDSLRKYLLETPQIKNEELWCRKLEIDDMHGVKETFEEVNVLHAAAIYGSSKIWDVVIEYGIGHLKNGWHGSQYNL